MSELRDRIEALRSAGHDYEYMLRSADDYERRAIVAKLIRIRRQIAMLTEDQRTPTTQVRRE